MTRRILTTLAIVMFAFASLTARGDTPANNDQTAQAAADMANAANKLLDSLSPDQKAKIAIPFDDPERENWQYMPMPRKGVPLKEFSIEQQVLVNNLLKSALSDGGFQRIDHIIHTLEPILHEQEKSDTRDPGAYYTTIFDTPGQTGNWGWRFEGHHITLNFTIHDGQVVGVLPMFMGANPATVKDGSQKGLRTLNDEENLAWKLVRSLDDDQGKLAVISSEALGEITVGPHQTLNLPPTGVSASTLNPDQQKTLHDLLSVFANRLRPELAQQQLQRIDAAGFDKIHFAWMGGLGSADLHSFRINGPTVLIELVNKEHANHVHTIWHDPTNDFGRSVVQPNSKQ